MIMPTMNLPAFLFVFLAALILLAVLGFALTYISYKTGKPLTISAYGTRLLVIALILGAVLAGAMLIDGPRAAEVRIFEETDAGCQYPDCELNAVYAVRDIYTSEMYEDLRGEDKRAQSYVRRYSSIALNNTAYLNFEARVCAEHLEQTQDKVFTEIRALYNRTPGHLWVIGFGICGMIMILWAAVCLVLRVLRKLGVIKPRKVKPAIYEEQFGQ
ncbi:MAG: hypothetical protein LBN97_05980 [Oscillospiraceae bacterium]|jgi:hypothetical protein|nr:hypothetical protein [Oscillospiraceae bacterium]